MGHRQVLALIELHEGEGGGGDILIRGRQGADQGPGQGRFPRPQGTGQAEGISRFQNPGNGYPQTAGRSLIRQVYAKG